MIDDLPPQLSLRYLGDYRLTPLSRPQPVAQLCHPNLRSQFPPLRSLELVTTASQLTAREREIVELVAHGYSNRHIAETLVVASSTVERHIANVLSKLDLHSRTQIAVWVTGNVQQFSSRRRRQRAQM